MRRGRIALALAGVALFGVLCVGLWLRLFAGGPVLFFPGGPLRGERAAAPVADWSFAAREQYLDVQARGRYLPWSQRSWFMVHEGGLYLLLPRLFGDGLERRIEENPDVIVRIAGVLHPVRASRHGDDAQLGALLAPVVRRTMAVEIGGRVTRVTQPLSSSGGIAVFRLESAPPAAR